MDTPSRSNDRDPIRVVATVTGVTERGVTGGMHEIKTRIRVQAVGVAEKDEMVGGLGLACSSWSSSRVQDAGITVAGNSRLVNTATVSRRKKSDTAVTGGPVSDQTVCATGNQQTVGATECLDSGGIS